MTQDSPMMQDMAPSEAQDNAQSSVQKSSQPIVKSTTGSIILGVLMVVSGFAAITLPFAASLAFTFWIGWLLIGTSLVKFVYAFQSREQGGFVMKFLLSVLYLVAGVMLVAQPLQGIATLTLLLASFFFVEGISELVLAYQLRSRPNWGWVLFNGIVTLVLGVMIGTGWPLNAPWVIGTLVGISLTASGVSRIMLALNGKGHEGAPTAA
ncbi:MULTISPECIES: HdeD family acid-resistance protein [unclassified Leptolyngbya]|uniref:HdeD family acid-resistance protein n=1 Tax=unclassified Leptolyngbya TaxID=2650499 RepID=UPI0018EFEE42|nr:MULTISPECIES: HdeD family acid-resistance protein [unclassified Leptolyngbya]